MPLNKNNFLRWEGVFLPAAPGFTETPVEDFTLHANQEFCTGTPLSLLSSVLGIDYGSFTITFIEDGSGNTVELASPPQWDTADQKLFTYRPLDLTYTFYLIHFNYSDPLGNTSGDCLIKVNIDTVYVEWVPDDSSVSCVFDAFGGQTGYKEWAQLKLINMSTGVDISPLQTKDNSQGDPDYYPPVQDYISCAPSGIGSYSALIISNFTLNVDNKFITINNIFLNSSNLGPGGTPFTQNIPCNIPPNKSVRFMVPTTDLTHVYDGGISIDYTISGDMDTATPPRYWKKNISGVITGFGNGGTGINDNQVVNSSPITQSSFEISTASLTIIAQ